jgi:signal transduction histidine kinase
LPWKIWSLSGHPDLFIHLDISAALVHMPEATMDTAYHVVQEAITNAVRHSGATNLWLTFLQDGDAILVDIQDNGSGMASVQPNLAPTYGLRGMRERVEAVGGRLSIRARQPKGTAISARFACETELR